MIFFAAIQQARSHIWERRVRIGCNSNLSTCDKIGKRRSNLGEAISAATIDLLGRQKNAGNEKWSLEFSRQQPGSRFRDRAKYF